MDIRCLAFVGGLILVWPAAADEIRLADDAVVVFASLEQGRAVLLTEDRFTAELSRFDLEARLQTHEAVTTHDLLRMAADQVLGWEPDERTRLRDTIASARARIEGYRLPFPERTLLVKTTGKEEGGAAYCRSNAIILPQNRIAIEPARLERLLLHELFHILSSHDAALRHKLYEIVGFHPCSNVELPPELAELKITNPDGPSLNYFIRLEIAGQERAVVPLLYASGPFDPQRGGTFFDYLQFQLLAVEPVGAHWQAVTDGEQLVMFDPNSTPAFRRAIGSNTNYVFHPDEILAENFVHLAMRTMDLPSPEVIEAMRRVLQSQR